MSKIEITFSTGENIRFLGCDICLEPRSVKIYCGNYVFEFMADDIEVLHIEKGVVNAKEIEA